LGVLTAIEAFFFNIEAAVSDFRGFLSFVVFDDGVFDIGDEVDDGIGATVVLKSISGSSSSMSLEDMNSELLKACLDAGLPDARRVEVPADLGARAMSVMFSATRCPGREVSGKVAKVYGCQGFRHAEWPVRTSS